MKLINFVCVLMSLVGTAGFNCLSACNCQAVYKECKYPGGTDSACICLYDCPE